ncbi:transcriptional regulator, TetR family [Thalassoporum mexicanum PCC 7367]|uniref:TetR/AcrR family transcriptional regulator n=1 Tax=Thalassoporum mexicanum TaxID=3457544 RepID=UPI00029FBEF9|nr:TetR/AcrR family transcriptional regulator [Pseudanabaena sp. PCC 7367]AFY69913.1 transcriptional regulator, TetR family [Pseudanabaena sp. PCC 7367]
MTRGPAKQFDTEKALTKAMEVFWARGYEAASLSELLKQMGIGKKSLYDTFGNKRSLFLKALEHYVQIIVKPLCEILSASGSPLANLKQALKAQQEMNSQPGSRGCMIGTNIADFCIEDEAIAKVLRGYLKRLEDNFCDTISRAQKAGEISTKVDARDLARLFISTTQGMVLIGRILDDKTMLESTVNAAITLIEK